MLLEHLLTMLLMMQYIVTLLMRGSTTYLDALLERKNPVERLPCITFLLLSCYWYIHWKYYLYERNCLMMMFCRYSVPLLFCRTVLLWLFVVVDALWWRKIILFGSTVVVVVGVLHLLLLLLLLICCCYCWKFVTWYRLLIATLLLFCYVCWYYCYYRCCWYWYCDIVYCIQVLPVRYCSYYCPPMGIEKMKKWLLLFIGNYLFI